MQFGQNGEYTEVRRLGKTIQGNMQGKAFIVKDKNSIELVLKLVEVADDEELEILQDQVTALKKLSHKSITSIHETFSHYDGAEESLYIGLIGEYFPTGDLGFVLEQQRSKNTALPEGIVKKWTGQLMEGLNYLHENDRPHRALKPNNIMLTESLDVRIGDYASPDVMAFAYTRPRTKTECRSWLPPEADGRVFGKAGDIWSLGCLLLDTCSTGFSDEEECRLNRIQLRQTPGVLSKYLKRVIDYFSEELCDLLRILLRGSPKERPPIADILGLPYIAGCLKLAKSTLVASEKAKSIARSIVKPTTTKRLPQDVAAIFAMVTKQIERVGVVVAGLEDMSRHIVEKKQHFELTHHTTETLKLILCKYNDNVFAQIAGVNLVRAVAACETEQNLIGFIPIVIKAIEIHGVSPEFAQTACNLLSVLSRSEECAKAIVDNRGIRILFDTWSASRDVADVVGPCCITLTSLCILESNMKLVQSEDYYTLAREALSVFADDGDTLQHVCSFLWILAMDDTLLTHIVDDRVALTLLEIMHTHLEHIGAVIEVSHVLSTICEDEGCVDQIVRRNKHGNMNNTTTTIPTNNIIRITNTNSITNTNNVTINIINNINDINSTTRTADNSPTSTTTATTIPTTTDTTATTTSGSNNSTTTKSSSSSTNNSAKGPTSDLNSRLPVTIIMKTFAHHTHSPVVMEAIIKMLKSMVQHADVREILTQCSVVEGLIGLEEQHRYRPSIKTLCRETLRVLTTGV